MKVLSAVLLLVGVCYTYGQDCPAYTDTKTDVLDIEKFIKVGNWLEIHTINKGYGDGDCTSVKYEKTVKEGTTDINYVKATYGYYKDKKQADTAIYLKPENPTKYKNKDVFAVFKDEKLTTAIGDNLPYEVLATDNAKYAIIFGCYKDGTKDKITRVAILSPDGTLADAEKTKINTVLKSNGVVELTDKTWATAQQDTKTCSAASIFGLSTVLSVIVAMILVLRN